MLRLFSNKLYLWLALLLSSLSAYCIPLFRFHNLFITRDWTFYNLLSYFNKSCWLYYKTLPLHIPYLFGGYDIMASPQSKIFSPLAIFDLIFDAPYANLTSLIILSVIGTYGMYKLLLFMGIRPYVSLLVSFIYAHSSWFALHFTEGHVVFGSFQLLSLVMLFTLNLTKPKYKIYFLVLLAFMLLDGSFYGFTFSLLLTLFTFIFKINQLSFKKFLISCYIQWRYTLLALFLFVGLSAVKLVPFISLHFGRTPIIEDIKVEFITLIHSFFNPFQHIQLIVEGADYLDHGLHFHEIGAYIGVFSFLLVIFFLIKKFEIKFLPWLLVLFVFLWIGTGFGGVANPWKLFQQIPFVNNLHIQTRSLIIVQFVFMVLLAFSLNYFLPKWKRSVQIIIVFFFIVEGIIVSNYPFYSLYDANVSVSSSKVYSSYLSNNTILKTYPKPANQWGFDFKIFETKNVASKSFIDNAVIQGDIKSITDSNYKGEVYVLEGNGKVNLVSYTPKGIVLNVNVYSESSEVQLNTNFLNGWKIKNKCVNLHQKNGLLTCKIPQGNHVVELTYYPKFLPYIISLYCLSVFIFIFFLLNNHRITFPKVSEPKE